VQSSVGVHRDDPKKPSKPPSPSQRASLTLCAAQSNQRLDLKVTDLGATQFKNIAERPFSHRPLMDNRQRVTGSMRTLCIADQPKALRHDARKLAFILQKRNRAFCTAKDRMQEQYVEGMTFNNMSIMLPWFSNLIDEDRALLGDDWWPYGIQRNRSAIDVVLRYHHEQGLTKRRLTIEDVFFPDLLDT
jgi:hypothetical protein